MKLLSKLFRRKPPTPPAPPTAQQGRAILQKAIEQTLDNGLTGYVIAEVRDKEGEVVFAVRGDMAEGLSKALELLLENPQTKAAAQYAIITALKAASAAREVRIVGDGNCDCPICTARRDGVRQTTTTRH